MPRFPAARETKERVAAHIQNNFIGKLFRATQPVSAWISRRIMPLIRGWDIRFMVGI